MSGAAVSMLAFALYLCAGGLLLLLAPHRLCALLSMAAPQGPWIRITGMLFLILAFYCWRAAMEDDARFVRWSVYTRPSTIVFLGWFVAAGWIEPVVLLFGALDLMATAWTVIAVHGGCRRRRVGARQPKAA
ncbi:MAG: hypothetical protein GEU82_13970 [Luteitalea sp.]|nr:hypothetical protein [Luteitalea sp.]